MSVGSNYSNTSIPSFDTVAVLKTINIQSGELVNTEGYISSRDRGGCQYVIKTAVQAAADGDTIDGYINFSLNNTNVAIKQHQMGVSCSTYAEMLALNPDAFPLGSVISVTGTGIAGDFIVTSGSVSDDGGIKKSNATWSAATKYLLRIFSGEVNVKWFGALGDGSTDDSTAFQNAVNTTYPILVPSGTYKINIGINNRTIIRGMGNTLSIVKPYDTSIAAMIYNYAAMSSPGGLSYWNYHSKIENLGFVSASKTGVGFSFGKTNPANHATNDEFANNVNFYNCAFSGFDKGVNFPFGNIGTSFYSCEFFSNRYGVYTINNKVGSTMHAGNKYFYDGEFHSNDCAIYLNNTADGFGAIILNGTILEYNNIAMYAYVTPRVVVPVTFNNVWLEGNGNIVGGSTTIDSWSGSTLTTQSLTNHTLILDGDGAKFNIYSGFVSDIYIKGQNIECIANDCRVESSSGFGGGSFIVDYPNNSSITLHNPVSDGGWSGGSYIPICTGYMNETSGLTVSPGARAQGRVFQTNPRSSRIDSLYGASLTTGASLTYPVVLGSGSFALTGTVVSDGVLFNSCNEFTRAAFLTNQYVRVNTPTTLITTSAGWYVLTVDMKIVSGTSVNLYLWDRSTAQHSTNIACPNTGKWYTFASIAYSPGGQSYYLDIGGGGTDVTWRMSAYQLHRFETQKQAQQFVMSNVFAENLLKKGTTANRPTIGANTYGFMYMDTTLDADGKPIWWNGTAWVDATGAVV